MKMKKTLITAVLLLTSMLLFMSACSSESAVTIETLPAAQTETETEDADVFPVINWGGRAFDIISRGSDYGAWESFDVFTENQTGEPINDAVWERNNIIFDRYGIEIKETKRDKLADTIKSLVMAGDAEFDAAVTSGADASALSSENYLVNLRSLPDLDLSHEWWDQNAARDFSFGDRLFFGVSDFLISDKDGSWVYVFNKRLADDLGIEYPYQMAKDGSWTYDQMHRLASAAVADLDGDGVMKPGKDRYGIATEEYDTYAAFFYSGARIFGIGDDGYPEYTFASERNFTAYNKYLELFVKDSSLYFAKYKTEREAFANGQALFKGYTLLGVRGEEFRAMEDDFGIIVAPKYDEGQKNYGHIVSIGTSGSVICVPLTAPDPDFTGYALDAVSGESTGTLLDTYINKGFNGKYLRDEESCEMLRLCLESRVYDLSIIYTKWGGLFTKLYGLTHNTKIDLASLNASVEDSVRQSLQEMIDMYKDID